MKKFLTIWIVVQLVFIGVARISIDNRIIEQTYDCTREVIPLYAGALFPLIAFVPETTDEIEYCRDRSWVLSE